MDRFTKSATLMEIRDENVPVQVAKDLYKDTLDESCFTCDLIIKCGPELYEYYCHRIILAGASEFLWTALSTVVPGTLPVLVLPDIKPTTLKLILTYIYNGHVQVPAGEYADFIEACVLLEIEEPVVAADTNLIIDIEDDDEPESIHNTEPSQEENDELEMMSGTENEIVSSALNVSQNDFVAGMETGDNDKAMQEESHVDEPRVTRNRKEMKRKNVEVEKREKPKKKKLMKMTPNMKAVYEEKAKKCIRGVYENADRKLSTNLDETVNRTRMVTEGNYLIRGEHACGFCGCVICFQYRGISWHSIGIKQHLKRKHNINYISPRPQIPPKNRYWPTSDEK